MSKSLTIVLAGGGEPREAVIEPGTTVKDLKRELGLGGFWLSKPGSDEFLGDSEVVYPLLQDGDKLVASLPAKVGSLAGPTPLVIAGAIAAGCGAIGWAAHRAGRSGPRCIEKPVKATSGSRGGSVPRTGPRKVLRPATARESGKADQSRMRVKPDSRPYWQQRHWSRRNGEYRGYYRTRFGAWEGRAVCHSPRRVQFFIIEPPRELLSGPHHLCFRRAGRKLYKIHMATGRTELNSGIVAIEKTLEESFKC